VKPEAPDPKPCPAWVAVDENRKVHCDKGADHGPSGPAETVHHGLLLVILPNGQVKAGSLVWDSQQHPWDEVSVARAT
jgi:hypothetical protein